MLTCPHCGGGLPMSERGGLTGQQKSLFDFIAHRIERDGIAPSYREMAEHLDLKSLESIHRLVLCLEERGRIRRLPNRARAIEIVGQGA